MQEEIIVQKIKKWIEKIVIEHNFCPFASRPFFDNKVAYTVVSVQDLGDFEQFFVSLCQKLEAKPDIPTELLIFPVGLEVFETYLDVLDICQAMIEHHGLEGVFQLASFHPDYQFEGVAEDDITNYTNRSPFPIIQLIKEESISEVLQYFKNPESIPAQNIERAKAIGKSGFLPYL